MPNPAGCGSNARCARCHNWPPIRVASHRHVTDRIAAVLCAWAPDQDPHIIWRRVRLAVELGYAVDEMLHEEDRIDREDLFGDAARAIEAVFATPGEQP